MKRLVLLSILLLTILSGLAASPVVQANITSLNMAASIPRTTTTPTISHTDMPTAKPTVSSTPKPNAENIVFVSERDGNAEIYIMNVNLTSTRDSLASIIEVVTTTPEIIVDSQYQSLQQTTTTPTRVAPTVTSTSTPPLQTRLTNNLADDMFPVLSPNGQQIAFSSDRDGNLEVYLMNVDGTNQKRLTNSSAWNEVSGWSPDGTRLIFASDQDSSFDIYTINIDGTNLTQLTNNSFGDCCAKWSPNEQKITFESNRDGNTEIYVMNADGSNQINLTNNQGGDFNPTWSPDGQKIAFESNRDGNAEIYLMSANGINQTNLTNHSANDYALVTWSPNGQYLAFTSDRSGNKDIYIMTANGFNQTRLTNNPANDFWPSWPQYTSVLPIPTIIPTVIVTPQPSVTPNPKGSDPYESDNACPEAKPITTNGLAQSHTFHISSDEDWVKFEGTAGTTYLVDARVTDDSLADVVLVMYDKCNGTATPNDSFNPEIHIQFKAPSTGTYYMHLTDGNDNGGANVAYQLSVRTLADVPSPGVLVLVAGKLRANDSLQTNIYNVTNNVYRLFTNQGYPPERITYLANDLKLDPDNDLTTQDVDNLALRNTLEQAILQAANKVGADRAFTLYMMDHGNEDKFYLSGSNQTVDPGELSGWLDMLEAAAPGVKVNVIIDACYSGSFIKGAKRLGKPGRVIIASTTDQTSAYASTENGAVFSDNFIQGLSQKWSLYDSFIGGRTAALTWYPQQKAWLDANGNGIPNEVEDFSLAQQRGFAIAGTFDPPLPPYIASVDGPTQIKNGQGELQALVRDDVSTGKLDVWAVIYKPSYVPPTTSEELVVDIETLPTIKLNGPDSNQQYRGLYEGFNENGTYRLVIYAKDEDGLISRPRELTITIGGTKVYLPLIVK